MSITSVGGSQDVFIAKYNTNGVLQWVVSAGGSNGESGNGITIDNTGNVIVTGQFSGTAQFGSTSLTCATDPSTLLPSADIFTTKLSGTGNFLWAKKGSADHADRGLDIATDLSGNIYVTGQFSDTITFDNIHYNNMYNAIFLIKYNSSGAEQWFRKIGGSSMNIAYGIAVDVNSNIYLTGDFQGTLIFFGPPDVQLTNTYQNDIFIAKYNNAGSLLWSESDGSSSEVSSRNIALDDSSNAYIVGNFKCTFSEYADVYGQGTFNTVGYKDIFVTKYNSNGQRQWMRQGGGKKEDFGAGITVNTSKQPIITGCFYDKIFFPSSNNFTFPNSNYFSYANVAYSGTYCNDTNYGQYSAINSWGSSDILIAKAIDLVRQPYDYYTRTPGNCIRPYVGSCINSDTGADNLCSGDSAEACTSISLTGATNASGSSQFGSSPGPYFNWHWSNGNNSSITNVNSSGSYSVTVTSQDGCYESKDSIYVTIHPLPARPLLSDNYIVNTNALNTQPINMCFNQSVVLTGINTASFYYWVDENNVLIDSSLSITTNEAGTYTFIVVDSFGCKNSNYIEINVDTLLTSIYPHIKLFNDYDHNDSVEICMGYGFTILIYDSLTNPFGSLICIAFAQTSWTITPNIQNINQCNTWLNCYPTQSGFYQIDAEMIRMNYCDTDTVILSKTIYVTVYPLPTINISISGNTHLCPGDTTTLTASSANNYIWTGSGIIGNPNQSFINVDQPGYYSVSTHLTDTNSCSASESASINIVYNSSPVVTMVPANGVICPNDSLLLNCSGTGNFQWYSSSGVFSTNTSSVYVSIPGYYYCVLNDTSGCLLASNTIEVLNFATPFLIATPTTMICPGSSCTIQVVSSPGSSIQWQSPLFGGALTQTISTAGIYYCHINLCGIMTDASIEITMSNPIAEITPEGPLEICVNDSITLSANSGMVSYQWSVSNSANQSVVVSQPGTYTLTTTDALGCTATDNFTMSLHTEIPAPLISDTSVCEGNSITLNAFSSDTVLWFSSLSGGAPIAIGSTYTTPILSSSITYYVQNADTLCQNERIPLTITVNALPDAPEINNNAPLCVGDDLLFSTNLISGSIYQWTGPNGFYSSLQNPEIQNISSINSGNYTLTCLVNGCESEITNKDIIINENPVLDLGNDTIICKDVSFVLNTGSFSQYLWQDGSTGSTYSVTSKGDYSVIVSDLNGCKTKDSITISFIDCSEINIPDVFTPNGDGFNDYFSIYAPGTTHFYCRIFNRWGLLIAIIDGSENSWDGIVQTSGQEASEGVYYYIIGYNDYLGEAKNNQGFFHLIR